MSTEQPSRRDGDGDDQRSARNAGAAPAPPQPLSPNTAAQQTARPGGGAPGAPPAPPPPKLPPPPGLIPPPPTGAAPPPVEPSEPAGRLRRNGALLALALLVLLALGGAAGFAVATLGGDSDSASTVAASDSGGSQDPTSVDVDDGVSADESEASGSRPATTRAPADMADLGGSSDGVSAGGGTDGFDTEPTGPEEAGLRYSLGPVSFLVPDEFSPMVQAELNEDGSLRSEFAGNGGQKIVVEINPGVIEMSGIDSARDLADSYRSNGRLLEEPYEVEVGGIASGVMNIEGKDGDLRADHFFNFEESGMAVVGADPTSLDSADSLARDVVSSLENS